MTQEENHIQELKKFLAQLRAIMDNYHHEIYLNDEIFRGFETMQAAVYKEINQYLTK